MAMELIKKKLKSSLQTLKQAKVPSVITILLIFTLILSSVVTYVAITNPENFSLNSSKMNFEPSLESNLLLVNLGLLLLLAVIISRKLLHLYLSRKRGRSGSRLLMKLVAMSSVIAIIPAIVVALSSSYYLNLGMKSWFDERVSRAVVESVAVADAYLKEHKEIVRADAAAMANEMNQPSFVFGKSSEEIEQYVHDEASNRLLAQAIVFR